MGDVLKLLQIIHDIAYIFSLPSQRSFLAPLSQTETIVAMPVPTLLPSIFDEPQMREVNFDTVRNICCSKLFFQRQEPGNFDLILAGLLPLKSRSRLRWGADMLSPGMEVPRYPRRHLRSESRSDRRMEQSRSTDL